MPLIAFEGIDGSGKSSALRAVADRLRAQGIDVAVTREETDLPTGEAVRRSIQERWDPLATAFLFAADRVRHVAQLQPWLDGGRLVLTDRFVHSTYAYQGVSLAGHVPDPDTFLRRLHEGWCPRPDKVLLFDVEPEAAVERTARRGERTPYEKVEFLTKVRAKYLDLAGADASRFVRIDAGQGAEAVAEDAMRAVLAAGSGTRFQAPQR